MTDFGDKLAEAMANQRDLLPMEAEIWAAGADLETAEFVARMLRKQGYYLVRPDDIGWPEIEAFWRDVHAGQSVHEDGGGFMVRCILRLFGITKGKVVTYRDAAKALLEGVQ